MCSWNFCYLNNSIELYTKYDKILDGLKEFYNVITFTTSEKPIKRQKRNDYED